MNSQAGIDRPSDSHLQSGTHPAPQLSSTERTDSVADIALAENRPAPTDPYASRERHHNEGHGRRLTAAFEALEAFPVMVESRNRVLRLFEQGEPSTADIV